MSAAWVAGSMAVTGIASGAFGAYTAGKASDAVAASAEASARAQLTLGREQLAYAKELQDKWEGVFGPIQDSLSSYYQGLSVDSEAAKGLSQLQQSFSASQEAINKSLAQRGMDTSGLQATTTRQLQTDKAKAETQVIQQAPVTIANQKLGFLGVGLGQQNSIQQATNSGYNTMSQAYTNQQNFYSNQAAQATQAQSSAISGIGSSIGGAAQFYGYMK